MAVRSVLRVRASCRDEVASLLAQHPSRLRERQLLRIVAGQSEALARVEPRHGVGERVAG